MTEEQHKQQIDDFTVQVRDFANKYGKENIEWDAQRILATGCVLITLKHKHGDDSIIHTVCRDIDKDYLKVRMNGLDRIDKVDAMFRILKEDEQDN